MGLKGSLYLETVIEPLLIYVNLTFFFEMAAVRHHEFLKTQIFTARAMLARSWES